jgi:S-DNA-T family DNA segregation ATPase FtsK/SpoIIIE
MFGIGVYLMIRIWKENSYLQEKKDLPENGDKENIPEDPIHLLQSRNSSFCHPLLLKEVLSHCQAYPLILPLGQRKDDQKAVTIPMSQKKGLLVAGSFPAEVLHVLESILVSLLFRHTEEQLQVFLLDCRGRLKAWKGISHIHYFSSSEGNLGEVLGDLEEEIQQRKMRKKEGAFETEPMIVVVVEEAGDLMMSAPKEAESFFQKMSGQEHSGVFCILGTGRPSLDVITTAVSKLCEARLALPVSSRIESSILIGKDGAEKTSARGEALFVIGKGSAPTAVCLPYISSSEIQKVLGHFAA